MEVQWYQWFCLAGLEYVEQTRNVFIVTIKTPHFQSDTIDPHSAIIVHAVRTASVYSSYEIQHVEIL